MNNTYPWFIEGSSKARLVNCTPQAEENIAYIARVTSKKQDNPNFIGLLKYCIKHGHWSVFEQSHMTVEIVAPLAIVVQLLRHRSFCFQQFSGRYEDQQWMSHFTEDLPSYKNLFYLPNTVRLQDTKNRQNSLSVEDADKLKEQTELFCSAYEAALQSYSQLLEMGIAKEVARFVLPEGVYTRVYVTGSCRSWIHYIKVRDDEGVAQHEHVELARAARTIFSQIFPGVSKTCDEIEKEEPEAYASLRSEILELRSEIDVLRALLPDATIAQMLPNY
jgi:thymidylate synthase (FAD)